MDANKLHSADSASGADRKQDATLTTLSNSSKSAVKTMEVHQPSETVTYNQKEYTETLLNSSTDGPSNLDESNQSKRNTVYVSSLEDDEEPQETWPYTCEELPIKKTIPHASVFEKYISKTLLSPGLKGVRPHFKSNCTIVFERIKFLGNEFSDALRRSQIFSNVQIGVDINFMVGFADTEIDRALELAVADMCEGERSEIILNACLRTGEIRGTEVEPVPCLKCIIVLIKVSRESEQTRLSLLNCNEEDKYNIAMSDKTRGIDLFKRQQYVDAFYRFSAGAKVLMTMDCFLLESEDKNTEALSLYSTLCSNMAECQIKEKNSEFAITLCKKALAYDPHNVKALYRQASAAWTLGDVDQADSLLKQLFELDASNSAAKHLNIKVQSKIREYEDEYARMMKRIFK